MLISCCAQIRVFAYGPHAQWVCPQTGQLPSWCAVKSRLIGQDRPVPHVTANPATGAGRMQSSIRVGLGGLPCGRLLGIAVLQVSQECLAVLQVALVCLGDAVAVAGGEKVK